MRRILISFFILGLVAVGEARPTHVPDSEIENGAENANGKERRKLKKGRAVEKGQEGSERPKRPIRIGGIRNNPNFALRERARNGCPDGSVAMALSPDGMDFILIFNQFQAEITAASGKTADRIACHVQVPFEVPANQRITITNLDYRGFANLPPNTVGALRAAYAFDFKGRGPSQPRDQLDRPDRRNDFRNDDVHPFRDFLRGMKRGLMVVFTFKLDGNEVGTGSSFNLSSQEIVRNAAATSQCGGATNLRLNTMLLVKSQAPTDALFALDTIDGSAKALRFYMRYDSCDKD